MRQQEHLPRLVALGTTALILVAASTLSYASLTRLAARADVAVPMLWPVIVDGIVVAATVALVAHGDQFSRALLVTGASLSLTGNVIESAVQGPLPTLIRAGVAAVPPLALVAVAHLAVTLRRATASETPETPTETVTVAAQSAEQPEHHAETDHVVDSNKMIETATDHFTDSSNLVDHTETPAPAPPPDPRQHGLALLAAGISPVEVAAQLGISRATAYRWQRTLTA